jgi:hypothetical protein
MKYLPTYDQVYEVIIYLECNFSDTASLKL